MENKKNNNIGLCSDIYRPISYKHGMMIEVTILSILVLGRTEILSPTQTGYRKHRSTEDQLALIAQEIENAFQEKKKVVSVFFDLTKAFDKVWRECLLLKILESGVSGKMYRWIRCFLHNRSARVKLDGHLSKSMKMREGVPQGGVISPTLSCTSTSRLCFPDMSPTPYMQMISPYGAHLNTPHLLPTESMKL